MERKEYPEVPVSAVREAVINAFGHRVIEPMQTVEAATYGSYIDIYSPVNFPHHVSPGQFIEEDCKPIKRNPFITRTLYFKGYGSVYDRTEKDLRCLYLISNCIRLGHITIFFFNIAKHLDMY